MQHHRFLPLLKKAFCGFIFSLSAFDVWDRNQYLAPQSNINIIIKRIVVVAIIHFVDNKSQRMKIHFFVLFRESNLIFPQYFLLGIFFLNSGNVNWNDKLQECIEKFSLTIPLNTDILYNFYHELDCDMFTFRGRKYILQLSTISHKI